MLSTDQIPQADRLERVLQLVVGQSDRTDQADHDERDLAYYRQAARILGWLDEQQQPTAAGLALRQAPEERHLVLAARAFASSPVGQAWLHWSGLERLDQLDEDSAEDFLAECCEASSSTASRRARTLKSWLRVLRSLDAPHIEGEAGLKAFLAGVLADPAVPTRMLAWAERNQLRTIAELVARDPASLRGEKNLRRKSISDTDAFLLSRTGCGWEVLRAQLPQLGFGHLLPPAPASTPQVAALAIDPTALAELGWDQLSLALPESVRTLSLTRLDLPTRMRNFCERQGITTVYELLQRPAADLQEAPNLGRGSLKDTRDAIVQWLAVATGGLTGTEIDPRLLTPTVADYTDFFALWRQRLATLSTQERLVITQRIGVAGESATLESIGDLLGVTRERVRQLESKAIEQITRERWWSEGIEQRLEQACALGAVSLSELAQDPWFRGVDQREDEFRYFLKRFAVGNWTLDEMVGHKWLSHTADGELQRVERSIVLALRDLEYPCTQSAVETLIASHAASIPSRLQQLLVERFKADLHRGEQAGEALYTGYGQTRQAEVLAFVRASTEPVSVRTIEAEFGRGTIPDELVYVRRGAVMAPQNIPGFATWQERLAPACVALMQKQGAERQWSAEELMGLLPAVARLPEWLTSWHLAGMLRLSGQVVYLGKLRVCLPDMQRESRVFLHDIARKVLLNAGGPLGDKELRARIEQQAAVTDLYWSALCNGQRAGVVRVTASSVGLIDRDVPGGEKAFAEASEILADHLNSSQVGLSILQALTVLREADAVYTSWTREMVHAVGRSSASLRTAVNGSLGLADWEDVRVPGQREIIRQALDEADAPVPLEEILDKIESLHGTRPTRAGVVNVIASAGARLRGAYVIDASSPSTPPAALARSLPQLADLPGIPPVTQDLFHQYLQEPLGDFSALAQRCVAHAREFVTVSQTNEFVSAAEAEQMCTLCLRLIHSLHASSSDIERRLVWATARYFEQVHDADDDFSIGGLDDDIALANAVAGILGHDDWCISS